MHQAKFAYIKRDNMIKDPFILLSYINTNLRDLGIELDSLCDRLDLDKEEIITKLGEIGYSYNEKVNQFKEKE